MPTAPTLDLTAIEQTRFPRGVVSRMSRDGCTMSEAAQITQKELMQFAIKKVITYAAIAEKAALAN